MGVNKLPARSLRLLSSEFSVTAAVIGLQTCITYLCIDQTPPVGSLHALSCHQVGWKVDCFIITLLRHIPYTRAHWERAAKTGKMVLARWER